MTTQLNDKLLAVPVPSDAYQFYITHNNEELLYKTNTSPIEQVKLPEGKWKVLGLCSPKEIGFDPKLYIESTSYNTDIDGEVFLYLDYPKHNFDWINPADSFRSLLQSKGLEEGHYLIISKI